MAEGAGAGFDQTGRGPKREYCDDDGDGDGDKMEGDIQNGEGLSKRFKLHNREHIKGVCVCVCVYVCVCVCVCVFVCVCVCS